MNAAAGRLLGIDLGTVRIGLALSDPLGLTAQPLESYRRVGSRRDLEHIARIVGEREVTRIVLGLPLLLSGDEGERAVETRRFAERLGARLPGVPVELWDERWTTREAERTMIRADLSRRRRRRSVDALAATLILQSFLDAEGATPRPVS